MKRRLSALGNGYGLPIVEIASLPACCHDHACRFERVLQRALADRRLGSRQDWFRLTEDELWELAQVIFEAAEFEREEEIEEGADWVFDLYDCAWGRQVSEHLLTAVDIADTTDLTVVSPPGSPQQVAVLRVLGEKGWVDPEELKRGQTSCLWALQKRNLISKHGRLYRITRGGREWLGSPVDPSLLDP